MNTLSTYQPAALVPAQDLPADLFSDFVAFIDRTEKTTQTYTKNLRQFAAWLSYNQISRPVRADVVKFRDWLGTEHKAIKYNALKGWEYRRTDKGHILTVKCQPATIRGYLQSVKAFFRWTAACGYYPNIADNIHTPKLSTAHKKDSLSASEVLDIEQSIKASGRNKIEASGLEAKDTAGRMQRASEQEKRLYAMYLLAVNGGLRTVEISRANVKDLEAKGGNAWLYVHGKGHAEADQKKPLAKEVYAAITDYLDSRTDKITANSPLFVATGNRSHGQRLASTTISSLLKKAMQTAGYDSERLTAHSLRHTTGQLVMEMTSGNIYMTQMYMRHTSPATTEIYLENDNAAQDNAMAARLYDSIHGQNVDKSKREQLHDLIERLTADQVDHLTAIAAAMASN